MTVWWVGAKKELAVIHRPQIVDDGGSKPPAELSHRRISINAKRTSSQPFQATSTLPQLRLLSTGQRTSEPKMLTLMLDNDVEDVEHVLEQIFAAFGPMNDDQKFQIDLCLRELIVNAIGACGGRPNPQTPRAHRR